MNLIHLALSAGIGFALVGSLLLYFLRNRLDYDSKCIIGSGLFLGLMLILVALYNTPRPEPSASQYASSPHG